MKNNVATFIQEHLPADKTRWGAYSKIFLPIIAGSILFALNGVVDNFMVGHINQGQAALGAMNSWTGILMGYFIGTAAAGSVIAAQFYHAKKHEIVKEIARYRHIMCMIPTLILALIAWVYPEWLAKVWIGNGSDLKGEELFNYNVTLDNSVRYARVIAIQWVLISITFNLGNQLRELGYVKIPMIWSIGALGANITLNSILMYGIGMGVEGAAWASVAGRLISLTIGISAIIIYKITIGFKPWTIFKVSAHTQKLYWHRWVYKMSLFTVNFFVIFRSFFYSRGYPFEQSMLGVGVTGISVVALTGALMNIFTTTFASLASMSANFVGSELGRGNLKQAKINGNELKGFVFIVSVAMSLLLLVFASVVPYMGFLSRTQFDKNHNITFDGTSQLKQVSHSLYVIAAYYPIWIWFSSSYRIGNAGGKGNTFSIIDWVITLLQLPWLALIVYMIVPTSPYMQHNFWAMYSLFFASDFLKLIFQEFVYYKYDWLNSLTHKHVHHK